MKYRWLASALFLLLPIGILWANLPADFDNDGDVDFSDFVTFASRYGANRGDEHYDETYDINRDGAIDVKDYAEFAAEFGNNIHADKIGPVGRVDELAPTRADTLEMEAKSLRDDGNYVQAIQKYREFVATVNDSVSKVRGLNGIGIAYVALDSLDQAAQQLTVVVEEYGGTENRKLKDQLVNSTAYLGQAYYLQGNKFLAWVYWSQIKNYLPSHASTSEVFRE